MGSTCLQESLTITGSCLTLISSLSSKDRPEVLGIWTLWVHPFLDGLHLARPAAHVLLCLDEGG